MAFDCSYTKEEFAAKGKIFPFSKRFRGGSVPPMHLRTSISAPCRGTPTVIRNINTGQRLSNPSLNVLMSSVPTRLWNYNIRRASIATPVVLEKTLRSNISTILSSSMPRLTNLSKSSPSQNLKIFRLKASSGLPEVVSIQNTTTASRVGLFELRSSNPLNKYKYNFDTSRSPSSHYNVPKVSLLKTRTAGITSASSKDICEKEVGEITPVREESLSKLRARAQLAKEHLNKHKILLDRYLPVNLGSAIDVVQEVETRYGELLLRMPQLDQQRLRKNDPDFASVIVPYKPASGSSKERKPTYEIKHIPVKNSFTSKISDTRKKARSVLCKIKGDPHYFDF